MSRFTIRDLLLATALVAVAVGWWVDRSRANSAADKPAEPPARHFQMIAAGKNNDKLYLYEPETGGVWERNSNGVWSPHTAPVVRPTSKR
jgi:hypothetical protein